ncbi:MAG: hypothetical protein U1F65_05770 [Verrucomicrobiota bacterium]
MIRLPVQPTPFPSPDAMPSGTLAQDTPGVTSFPRGKRYHAIWNEFGDDGTLSNGKNFTVEADIKAFLNGLIAEIHVKVGTKTVRTMTAYELYAEYKKYGSQFSLKTSGTAGQAAFRVYLPIWFASPWRSVTADKFASAWNVVGVDSFQIEVVFKSGVVSPVWTGWYEWDALALDDNGKPVTSLGLIEKWDRKALQALGSSNTFDLDRKGLLQEITFYPTVEGTPKFINKLRATLDDIPIRGFLTVVENQAMLISREMFPDTAAVPRFEWVIDYTDPTRQWLPLDGAEAFEVYVEYNAAAAGGLIALVKSVQPL